MTRRSSFRLLFALLAASVSPAWASFDLAEISLEELTQARILSAPKFSENPDEIPSTVSILTARDIRTYGWRTLGDALRTLQGYQVIDDQTYSYASSRGISPAGDYRARMQILIDGVSINENIYASAPSGTDFPLDMGLIERIEVIRGPSASVYGGDSMFGVINVVTRNGQDVGREAALSWGSGQAGRLRASWGGSLGEADALLSISGFGANGSHIKVHDLDPTGERSTLRGVGEENGGQLFLRLRGSDWRVTLIHGERDRHVPTGSYGTLANDSAHLERDRYSLLDLGKDWQIHPQLDLYQRIYFGEYGYDGRFPYDYSPLDPHLINVDRARGTWWGTEHRLVSRQLENQRWTFGFEFKAAPRQDQINYDAGYGCVDAGTAQPCLNARHSSQQVSIYLQDEWRVSRVTTLTLGLRYDYLSYYNGFASPRLGLVRDAGELGLFKALYGSAFRTPQVYERFYTTPTFAYGNPGVEPEKMDSLELAWEKRFSPLSRLSVTYNLFRIRNMIAPDRTGFFANGSAVYAQGVEIEHEEAWQNGIRLRIGYSGQHSANRNGHLDNAPRNMVKMNLAVPTSVNGLTAALEAQWVDSRRANLGNNRLPAYTLANLNFSYQPEGQRWDAGLGIYNLFDHRFADPTSPDPDTAIPRWQMPQLGRTWQLRTNFRF